MGSEAGLDQGESSALYAAPCVVAGKKKKLQRSVETSHLDFLFSEVWFVTGIIQTKGLRNPLQL